MAIFGVVSSESVTGMPGLFLRPLYHLPDAEIFALEQERGKKQALLCKTKLRLLNIDERLKQLYAAKEETEL